MIDTSKVIHAPVGGGRYTVTAPIVKEDYGLYLLIEGLELPSTYEVDFSNSEHNGTSVTMIGDENGVLIPSQFISSGKDVFAFLYHVGANYGRTVFKFRIPNKLRPDRTNETPTPEEQSVIDQAISALNSAVAQTAQDVIDADASAQNASADAERAEEARTDAQNFATQAEQAMDDAQTYANNASASASASATSASQSAQIKDDVEGMVDDAQASASASYQSAQTAQGYASNAQLSATQASNSAMSANQLATDALAHANTASSKASEASQSATTASQKASEASASALSASGYATQAESAKTSAQTAQGLAESARDDAIDAKTDAESARDEAQSIVDGISGKVEQIDSNTERIESLEDDRYKPYAVDTASGAIASFTDGADDIPLKSLIVNIDPVQDTSSGDPSPENICPISGWIGANVVQSGKNLSNLNVTQHYGVASRLYVFVSAFLKAGTYYLNVEKTAGSYVGTVGLYLKNDNGGSYARVGSNYNILHEKIFTIPEDGIYSAYINSSSLTSADEAKISLTTDGSIVYDYHRTIIPITFGQTVYGGKLDVLNGILTAYPHYASYNGETLTGRWISDRDVYAVGTTPTIGAQVVNIGAQGTEIQLEPHEIASLLGQNNIYADTGDTACEYRADTTLYISRLTEPDADMIADSNITSGKYFMVGNNLYKATANIASGASVIVGTNAIRKSLSEALNEINA